MKRSAFEASKQIANSSIDGLRHRLHLESNVLSWIAEILSQSENNNPIDRTLNANDRDAIDRIIAEMRNDPGREYSIHDLSKLGCLNEHKLKLAFKSTLGKTAFTFLREVRMDRAAELLKNDRHSVIQVANEVGYSNASHFARAFKDRHGLLPKAYQCLQRLS
jgi:AraC-like DNA-binding protein